MEIAEGNEHFDVNSFISYRFQGESNKILNQQIKVNNNNTNTKYEFKVKYEGY